MSSIGLIPAVLARIVRAAPPEHGLWLVGGAVRDHFLNRRTTDFDLAYQGPSLDLARRLADEFSGAYYALDEERETGRALLELEGHELRIDIARLAGSDILADLSRRDFTVNAMAVAWDRPDELIDPLHGLADLKAGVLRTCSSDAIANDPLRAMRAVRLAHQLDLKLTPETAAQIRAARREVFSISGERRRDELFRILQLEDPAAALRVLHHLGILEAAIMQPGEGPAQLLEAGLRLLEVADELIRLLAQEHNPQASGMLNMAQVSLRLGRFRKRLMTHFEEELSGGRSRLQLLLLAALISATERRRAGEIPGNTSERELESEEVARGLGLSSREAAYLSYSLQGRRMLAIYSAGGLTPSEIYRYFRKLGSAGIGGCLLWLANELTSGAQISAQNGWVERVETARAILGAYFEGEGVRFGLPDLVTGDEMMASLGLEEGPLVGSLIEALREAHAVGEISDRDQALVMARDLLVQLKGASRRKRPDQG